MGEQDEGHGCELHAPGVEAPPRRVQRRLSLSRRRQDHGADRQGICPGDGATMKQTLALLAALTFILAGTVCAGEVKDAEMAGYLLVSSDRVPDAYNAGFSLYAAAWPLLQHYPGHRFQTGLFGTWMNAQYKGKPPADLYSDIEGGLGWWRDTRFPTETPKFIMGGVAVNFKEIANGPAHGAGNWEKPRGLYGVAQLSPWLLFPIDGLDVKQGACGDLFGYGYLPLPLTAAKPTTGGVKFASVDAEQGIPDGDSVCARRTLRGRQGRNLRPHRADLLSRRRGRQHRRPSPPDQLQQKSPLQRR